MARITWLGEDGDGTAGPSFTTCFGGIKFPKGTPVEVSDPDHVRRAQGNSFFSVEVEEPDPVDNVMSEVVVDPLKGLTIAELRNMADASGIDHEGLSKADLREAIRAHDEHADVQDAG
jgi:hypothetical protein